MDTQLHDLLERLWVNLDSLNNHLADVTDKPPVEETESYYAQVIDDLRSVYTNIPIALKQMKALKHNSKVRHQEYIASLKERSN